MLLRAATCLACISFMIQENDLFQYVFQVLAPSTQAAPPQGAIGMLSDIQMKHVALAYKIPYKNEITHRLCAQAPISAVCFTSGIIYQ